MKRYCAQILCWLALASAAISEGRGSPGVILFSLNPPMPLVTGQVFTVTLRIENYTDSVEIDRFNFRFRYPPSLFEFVPGSFQNGGASGPNQQWLSKSPQEPAGGGYTFQALHDGATPGTVVLHARDAQPSMPERGTLAESGFLASFQLRATNGGEGLLRTLAAADGGALYNTSGAAAGLPAFGAASVLVLDMLPPTLAVGRSGTNAVLSWPASATGYELVFTTDLNLPGPWPLAGLPVQPMNGTNVVLAPLDGLQRYFRLRKM
jgi:hypothetical protein